MPVMCKHTFRKSFFFFFFAGLRVKCLVSASNMPFQQLHTVNSDTGQGAYPRVALMIITPACGVATILGWLLY